MNASTVPLAEMVNSSVNVLTKPSITTFEQYEKRGTTRDALIYVAAAAIIAGLVGFVFNLFGGIAAAIAGLLLALIGPVVGFFIFTYVLYYVGKQQGGTGTQDEVFYSCSLYVAPLLAISGIVSAIPIIGCLFLPVLLVLSVYQVYLGYLASRSSMNLAQTPAIISVVAAIIAQILVGSVLIAVLGGILLTNR